jgi:serine/threonine-protein kinase
MRKSNATQPVQGLDPMLGRDLGEYRVLELIGEGGMGVVYRGVQPVIKKRVAIKVLKANVAGDPQHVRRLTDEAEAVNSIRHRNIIDIFSLGQLPDGRPYIVMEYLEGQPLDAYLRQAGQLPLQEALSLLIAVCGPLAAAHRANVIHRDLKPSNVFVCQTVDGEHYLKLLDFGLAKKAMNLDGTTEQTSRAAIIGTPNYMAPEQARGELVSARTDLYALGVMAYELLTGELPYSAPGPMEVLMLHVSGPIPSVRDVVPSLPVELDELVRRMMAKAPEDRPPSVDLVRQTLIALARTLGTPGSFATLDPVSGEFRPGVQVRPLVTPTPQAAIAPTPPAPLDATLLSGRTLRVSWQQRAIVLGAVIAVLGGILALVGLGDRPAQPAGAGSSAGAAGAGTAQVAGAGATPTGAEGVRPSGAGATPTGADGVQPSGSGPAQPAGAGATPTGAGTAQVAGAGSTPTGAGGAQPSGTGATPTGSPAVLPSPTVVKHTPAGTTGRGEAPTSDALRKRVADLEAALLKGTPAGEEPDPSAVTLLRKYKVEATMVESPAERQRLSKDLAAFQRTFLPR